MIYFRNILIIILTITSVNGYSQTESLSISEAVNKSLENNYGIQISRADTEVAAMNNNWGTAGRYPSIGFDASANNSYNLDDSNLTNRFSAGIGLNWMIFDGFRVNTTKLKLENIEELTSGRLAVLIESTIQDIYLSYYSVLLQQEQLNVLKTVMDLSRDRYDYELKRKSLGSSLSYDVLQAENVYLSDKSAFLEQEMQVRNAIRSFNFILTEDPGKAWVFTESFEADTSRFLLSDLISKMTDNNQTLKNQYTNLVLEKNETALKQSEMYPSISVATGIDNSITRTQISGAAAQNFNSYMPYGNLRLSYDLYTGGVRKRGINISKINEEIATIEIEQMEHSLTNELYSLYDYYEVRISLLNVANRSLEAADLNMKISGEKYRSGAINSFNYRDVQLMYMDASLRRLQSIYNLIDSRTRLTRITGGFLEVGE